MDRSLDLAGLTQSEHGIDTIMHLTCTNMVQGTVDSALRVSTYVECRVIHVSHCLAECRLRKNGVLKTSLLYAEV